MRGYSEIAPTKLNICHHMLTLFTQLQNMSFHVVERTRTPSKCQKMRNARAKRAKIPFFIVKYANLWGFCCRCHRGCLGPVHTMTIVNANASKRIFLYPPHEDDHRLRSVFIRPHENARKHIKRCHTPNAHALSI